MPPSISRHYTPLHPVMASTAPKSLTYSDDFPKISRLYGPLAQLAEQLTLNQQVEGSIPSRVIPYSPCFSTTYPVYHLEPE